MVDFDRCYGWVKELPIVDWHNHLDMQMLSEDRPLGSLYEVWVKSDPYKHRAMRICGEPERLVTGFNGQDARCPSSAAATGTTGVSPVDMESEKWAAWMRTLPKLVGNPLFAWSRMELEWLGLDPGPYLHGTGENILLSDWTPSKMLKKFNVEYLSPCVGARDLPPLGQRASRPLTWSAPEVKEFPSVQACASSHFSHTLASGTFHRRNLPHVGQSATLVFVTFRLTDSLPNDKLEELAAFREEWLKDHPKPWDESTCREWKLTSFPKIEEWLDAGHGSCILADPALRKVVEDALEYFNDTATEPGTTGVPPVEKGESDCVVNGQDARCPSRRYRLHAYVVMPNHVHVLFELLEESDIQKILHSWKSYTAKKLNELTGTSGKVWKEEYYDRLIRNGEHYQNTIKYIRRNGEAAKALAESNGRDARCPSDINGQDARCPSVVPSLRMNAGEEVSVETLEKFDAAGCRVVDVSVDDTQTLKHSNSQTLSTVASFAAAHGWTMLLHMGALRETSARLRAAAGPAGGFAGMRAPVDPMAVAVFLNTLERGSVAGTTGVPPVEKGESDCVVNGQDARCPSDINGQDARCPSGLPRTILMSLNPEAHAQLAVLAGSFNGEGMPGKVQLGPAWWWCDHEEGIRDVLEKNAAYGVLSSFVGMTTDSRSLLSFVRHDYFRRVLCKWVAEKVASGSFPDDESLLRPLLENVCYKNAHDMIIRAEHVEPSARSTRQNNPVNPVNPV
jgi:glucuronate isomerase